MVHGSIRSIIIVGEFCSIMFQGVCFISNQFVHLRVMNSSSIRFQCKRCLIDAISVLQHIHLHLLPLHWFGLVSAPGRENWFTETQVYLYFLCLNRTCQFYEN